MAQVEAVVEHNKYTEVRVTGDTVRPGDYMVWVRLDYAALNVRAECVAAMNRSLTNVNDGDDWDGTPEDHGGVAYAVTLGGVTYTCAKPTTSTADIPTRWGGRLV